MLSSLHRSVFLVLSSLVPLLQTNIIKASDSFDESVGGFFESHCNRCHDDKKQKGDFRLDELSKNFTKGEDSELWFEVMDRINSGEMPPEDETQPTEKEIEQVVNWLGVKLKEGEAARMAARPKVAHYRLSRDEYAHTINDLLGVPYDPKAPGQMTDDPVWHGFQRIGSELSLSPSHVQKYIKAAKFSLDVAYPDEPAISKIYRKDALEIDWPNRMKRDLLKKEGALDKVRTLLWPGHVLPHAEPVHFSYDMPPGLYRGKVKVSGLKPLNGRPPHIKIHCKQLDRTLFEQDVIAPENEPVILEFETFLQGKISVKVSNAVPGPSNTGRSGRPTGQRIFTSLSNPNSRAPWQRKLTDDSGNPLYPLLIFDWIEWEGPIVSDEVVKKRKSFLPVEDTPQATENAITKFAKAAWRREINKEETLPYLKLIEQQQKLGSSPLDAYKTGMLAVLSSKNFFYLQEGSPKENKPSVSNHELASRLSYLIWNSMPDMELLNSAYSQKLSKPSELLSQMNRMLDDPKSVRFMDSFPYQWLQLNKLGEFPPDPKLYPEYDLWLEKSMALETTQFFRTVFRENLSVREFVDSTWSMLNPRLALHYGIPDLPKAGFQKVTLKPEWNRGGLMTQAATLALSSDGTRHRLVHRGVWVSEAIFGKTPNPPPPNVDPIEPNPPESPRATIRMKLEAHTTHASCASCHKHIDPLGFAFDNYNAVGQWRLIEEVQHGQGKHPDVDASGKLPNGRTFSGPAEFKWILCENLEPIAHAVVEKLATYALRRAMTVDDREAIEKIVSSCSDKDYRMRDLFESFVTSPLFLKR